LKQFANALSSILVTIYVPEEYIKLPKNSTLPVAVADRDTDAIPDPSVNV